MDVDRRDNFAYLWTFFPGQATAAYVAENIRLCEYPLPVLQLPKNCMYREQVSHGHGRDMK